MRATPGGCARVDGTSGGRPPVGSGCAGDPVARGLSPVDTASFCGGEGSSSAMGVARSGVRRRRYSALVDEWIQTLLRRRAADRRRRRRRARARRDLAPASDLDLVLIHDGRSDVSEVAERLWYPIWDAGVALDHSVRTPKEADRSRRRRSQGRAEPARRPPDRRRPRARRADPLAGTRAVDRRRPEAAHRRARSDHPASATRRKATLRTCSNRTSNRPRVVSATCGVLHALEVAAPVIEPLELTASRADLAADRAGGAAPGDAVGPTDRLLLQYQDDVAARLGLDGRGRADGRGRRRRPRGHRLGGRRRLGARQLVARRVRRDAAEAATVSSGRASCCVTARSTFAPDADFDDDSLILRAAEAAARRGIRFRRGALDRLATRGGAR